MSFSQSDKGLWDGRPSLGGVWVAHPDVKGARTRRLSATRTPGVKPWGALFKRREDESRPGISGVCRSGRSRWKCCPVHRPRWKWLPCARKEQRPAPEAAPDATAEPASETASAPPAEADSETAATGHRRIGTGRHRRSRCRKRNHDRPTGRRRAAQTRVLRAAVRGRDDAEPSEITTATLDAAPSATDAPAVAADAVPTMPTPMAGGQHGHTRAQRAGPSFRADRHFQRGIERRRCHRNHAQGGADGQHQTRPHAGQCVLGALWSARPAQRQSAATSLPKSRNWALLMHMPSVDEGVAMPIRLIASILVGGSWAGRPDCAFGAGRAGGL